MVCYILGELINTKYRDCTSYDGKLPSTYKHKDQLNQIIWGMIYSSLFITVSTKEFLL